MRALVPEAIAPPFARYVHGVEVPAGARLVFTSGQLGRDPSGTVPEGAEAQADICFSNIDAILAEAGATRRDVIKISAFVTDRKHMAGYMTARDRWMGETPPAYASTLLIVSGFTLPEYLTEIEVIAAINSL